MTLQTKFNLSRLGREGREGGLDTDSLAETSSTGSVRIDHGFCCKKKNKNSLFRGVGGMK